MEKSIQDRLTRRNEAIIQAVVEKAEQHCPGSLALIGIYGSFCTGDFYEKSDLDLLILINDEQGYILGDTFIQGGVGHDLYCTTWEDLEKDAQYRNPNLSKLMDSKIVYCADSTYSKRLENLRKTVKQRLASPLSESDLDNVQEMLDMARKEYADIMLNSEVGKGRFHLAGMLYCLENALCLLNKEYFRLGVKRTMQELGAMKKIPEGYAEAVAAAMDAHEGKQLQEASTRLLSLVKDYISQVKVQVQKKEVPSQEALKGTYEEMYSNWRNKMEYAVDHQDVHLSFMTAASFQSFLEELSEKYTIPYLDIMSEFDPDDLSRSQQSFDKVLNQYRQEYTRRNVPVREFSTMEDFVAAYLQK